MKASKTNSPDAWTVYDALGNRVATKINDIWQYVVYDAFGKLVAEYGIASEGTGGIKYIQQDWQGSVRTVSNNNGFVTARTDYTSFGEEIGFGTGLRSIDQGYASDSPTRQGYGLTEEDDATGLNHAWFRKNENRAGRWTSPDPYKGSMSLSDPQSFNRYSYVNNQPTNFVDPSGLLCYGWWVLISRDGGDIWEDTGIFIVDYCDNDRGGGGGGGGGTRGVGPKLNTGPKAVYSPDKFKECLQKVLGASGQHTSNWNRSSGNVFVGQGLDARSFTITDIRIRTDVNRDSSTLAADLNRVAGSNWKTQSGLSLRSSPSVNWVASDVASNTRLYTDIGVFALFIHELGNNIALQLSASQPYTGSAADNAKLGIGDEDIGAKFESCVFGGLVGLRTGRVGPNREL